MVLEHDHDGRAHRNPLRCTRALGDRPGRALDPHHRGVAVDRHHEPVPFGRYISTFRLKSTRKSCVIIPTLLNTTNTTYTTNTTKHHAVSSSCIVTSVQYRSLFAALNKDLYLITSASLVNPLKFKVLKPVRNYLIGI